MRSGYKITLGILTIMILVTITIGTSYSYYSIASTQTDPNELSTTCFDVDFSEGSNSIALNADGSYAYPMSEANALSKLKPYTFTVTNNCNTSNATNPVNYVVTLSTLTSTPSNLTPYLRYKVNDNTSSMLSSASPYDLGSIKNEEGLDTTYMIASGSLAPGAKETFNLYLWIDESADNSIMGNTFTGRVLVYYHM